MSFNKDTTIDSRISKIVHRCFFRSSRCNLGLSISHFQHLIFNLWRRLVSCLKGLFQRCEGVTCHVSVRMIGHALSFYVKTLRLSMKYSDPTKKSKGNFFLFNYSTTSRLPNDENRPAMVARLRSFEIFIHKMIFLLFFKIHSGKQSAICKVLAWNFHSLLEEKSQCLLSKILFFLFFFL